MLLSTPNQVNLFSTEVNKDLGPSHFGRNAKRQYGEKKKSSAKLDAIVRMRDVWGVELVAMESGRNDMLEGQTKMLSDRYKLARELKDQIDYLYASLPANHKSKIVNLEVFGILTSGESQVLLTCPVECCMSH